MLLLSIGMNKSNQSSHQCLIEYLYKNILAQLLCNDAFQKNRAITPIGLATVLKQLKQKILCS